MNTAEHAGAWLYFQREWPTVAGATLHDQQVNADEPPHHVARDTEPAPAIATAPSPKEVF